MRDATIIALMVMISFFCCYGWYHYVKKICRKRVDIEFHIGIALARINNVDEVNPSNKVLFGVGNNDENIAEWVEDIWTSFDKDGNGCIDKHEIEKFIE